MISSSARTIRQYCSVCKATLDMAVVETVQDHEVTWLKCPRCSGILPHMTSKEEPRDAVEEPVLAQAAVETPPPGAIPEADRAGARDYDPSQTYEVAEVVYHRSLNRYGRVLEKAMLPGKRAAIRVQFEDGESMTLREGL